MDDHLAASLEALVGTTFLERAEHFDEISSTNDRAADLGRDGGPLPALVVAERQTSGRGRGGNRWWSTGGALTFSIVLDRESLGLAPERLPLVALATGLAVRAAAADVLADSSRPGTPVPLVKWPNDVLVDDRKLAGVLVEESGGRVVIGVGLNANNRFDTAPPDVRSRACSLADLADRVVDRSRLLEGIVVALEGELAALRGSRELAVRWDAVCALTGRPVSVRVHESLVNGSCEGIDDSGALLVRTATGLERLRSGVVESFG